MASFSTSSTTPAEKSVELLVGFQPHTGEGISSSATAESTASTSFSSSSSLFKKRKAPSSNARTQQSSLATTELEEKDSSSLSAALNERKRKADALSKPSSSTALSSSNSESIHSSLDAIGHSSFASNRTSVADSSSFASQITVSIDRPSSSPSNSSVNSASGDSRPKWKRSGPFIPAANVKSISRFDYQPDVCKDYKQSGYCRFGDSCKFLHDRGDYKQGWQIENDYKKKEELNQKKALGIISEQQWKKEIEGLNSEFTGSTTANSFRTKAWRDEIQKRKKGDRNAAASSSSSASSEDIPFVCLICKQPYTDPIVTLCRHYFCQNCALTHHIKDQTCALCKKPTQGVFNDAKSTLKKFKDALKQKENADETDETKQPEEVNDND